LTVAFTQVPLSVHNAPAEYIGQTKRALRDRFGEHRRAIQNNTTDAVPQHFNQKGHKLTDIELIPLELTNSKREPIRRARESFYIDKAKTMQPHGKNSEDDYFSFFIIVFIDFLFLFFYTSLCLFMVIFLLSSLACLNFKFQTIVSYIYCNRFTTYCNDYPYFH